MLGILETVIGATLVLGLYKAGAWGWKRRPRKKQLFSV